MKNSLHFDSFADQDLIGFKLAALVGVYKKHTRPVNAVMALALVWCASELILELIRGLAR